MIRPWLSVVTRKVAQVEVPDRTIAVLTSPGLLENVGSKLPDELAVLGENLNLRENILEY